MKSFIFINSLIRRLRPDLCALYPAETPEQQADWLGWLMTSGVSEYRILKECEDFRQQLAVMHPSGLTMLQWLVYRTRTDVQKAFPLASGVESIRTWFYRHGVAEHQLWDWLSAQEQQQAKVLGVSVPNLRTLPSVQEASDLPFGVNLIGYAYGQLGIGEDLRMTAKALMAVDIPVDIVNFPPGKDIPQNDHSVDAWVVDKGRYAINVFCMTALEQGRYWVERGSEQLQGRYNIGYWPWELSEWPKEWQDLTALVDEVWVSTRHIYDALAPISPVPVQIMPLAVDVAEQRLFTDQAEARRYFQLPELAYLFCFSFDLNSSMHRKNPQAILRAFQQAFKADDVSVGLVIKAHKPNKPNIHWQALKALAEQDRRLIIVEQTLPRDELLALYAACDCFVSLHRAEGYGRGIAEAILLGKQVIATGYSGNVDFCYGLPQVHLIDSQLVDVNSGEYPYGEGQHWAEADSTQAASAMRLCVADHQRQRLLTLAQQQRFLPQFVGQRYAKRLHYISSIH